MHQMAKTFTPAMTMALFIFSNVCTAETLSPQMTPVRYFKDANNPANWILQIMEKDGTNSQLYHCGGNKKKPCVKLPTGGVEATANTGRTLDFEDRPATVDIKGNTLQLKCGDQAPQIFTAPMPAPVNDRDRLSTIPDEDVALRRRQSFDGHLIRAIFRTQDGKKIYIVSSRGLDPKNKFSSASGRVDVVQIVDGVVTEFKDLPTLSHPSLGGKDKTIASQIALPNGETLTGNIGHVPYAIREDVPLTQAIGAFPTAPNKTATAPYLYPGAPWGSGSYVGINPNTASLDTIKQPAGNSDPMASDNSRLVTYFPTDIDGSTTPFLSTEQVQNLNNFANYTNGKIQPKQKTLDLKKYILSPEKFQNDSKEFQVCPPPEGGTALPVKAGAS